jgi:hypothetical protein
MHIQIDRVFTTVARNLGLKDFSRYTNNWIEWSYEAEKLIGSRDTFVQKEATYDASGAQATGTITFAANPSSGDSITLNGVKLYFRNSTDLGQAKSPNEIEIGATLAATLDNTTAQYGLNQTLTGLIDVDAGTGTYIDSAIFNYPEALNVADYSINTTTGVLTITAKEIGPKGNDYTLASDNSNAKVSGLTLTGGKGIYRNQQITLPENNIKLLGVRVGTDDSDYEHAAIKKTSAVHRQRVGKTTDDSEQKAFRYYIDGNRLNIQHDNLDEITIVYLAYPVDLRGWPKIKEGHETAVAQYIMWQMKLIEFYNGKLPQYITKELEKRWYYLCGKARGDDSMPTSEELKQIGNMWNTLVPITNDRSSLIDF